MAETAIRDRLQSAASENARLLKIISETDYSVSACQQSENYVSTLKKQIAAEEKKLKEVNTQVAKEYDDHKRYRDSHMKRLTYKLGGKKEKFEQQASKEEKEWLEAVGLQLKTKKGLEKLNADLAEATKTTSELVDVATLHNHTVVQLDALYNSIFDGPTPGIPEEDQKENEVKEAQQNFHVVQLLLSTENQARAILAEADKFLKRAFVDIQEAKSAATADAWGIGGTFSEMTESSALSRCQQHVSQTEMLISQAQRVQPAVRSIGDMRVAKQDFLTDIVFDNIFSDMAMRDNVKNSMAQIQAAQAKMNQELQAADRRIRSAQGEVDRAKLTLDEKRAELQQIRGATFERLAADGNNMGGTSQYTSTPPAYTA